MDLWCRCCLTSFESFVLRHLVTKTHRNVKKDGTEGKKYFGKIISDQSSFKELGPDIIAINIKRTANILR